MGRLGDLPPSWVIVTCETCERKGCYRVSRLLTRFGPDIETLELLRALTVSCRHQQDVGAGKRRKYVPVCLATIAEPAWRRPDFVDLPVPTIMPYTIETWTESGGGIELHLGTLYRLDMADAAFEAACRAWPDTVITVRQRARVLRRQERPLRNLERSVVVGDHEPMCKLYSLDSDQHDLFRDLEAERDETGNMPPMRAIFPDQVAPVVIAPEGRRTLTMMRWGIPGPKAFGEQPVTNVRNVKSPHWRPWLKPAFRCLVPATSFCEYADTKPRKTPVWFALSEDRPLFAFAGIWRPWTGVRGTKKDNPDRAEEDHRLFSFLTTEANGIVGPVHDKAMPVLLTKPEEWVTWLTAPTEEALKLQRPLPSGEMREVARGERRDGRPGA